jgi:FlaG/FlaF family flagellin (archaellin)
MIYIMTAKPDRDRGAMPVVGNILLVAVVVIIAVTVVGLSFAFLEDTGTPTAEASFDFEETPAGLKLVPKVLGTDVTVKLNGQIVETIDADKAGQSVLLPTAPGDTVTVVSTDKERSVLIDEEIDERSEVGDFVAYYTFDQREDQTVQDRSGNGNDGGMNGGVSRVGAGSGTALDFNGSTGTYVDVGDLTVDGPSEVEEMTIAITYEHDGGSDIQNLVEHQDANFAWFMETDGKHGNPHQMEFNVGYQTTESGKLKTGDVAAGEKQVLVGTYDGEKMVLYRNGTRVGSTPLDREVALGQVILGADSDPSGVGQNLDGRIHEVRLYYTAFDGQEVSRLTTVMS